jgi:hypothetical protein
MITLKDFQKYETLEQDLKAFLFERCKEYGKARNWSDENVKYFGEDFDWWEFDGLLLKVFFREYRTYRCDSNQYSYSLPLDIVFENNFKELMRERYLEEVEQIKKKVLEERKRKEDEVRRLAEKKRVEEVEKLHELMKKYPDEVKNET